MRNKIARAAKHLKQLTIQASKALWCFIIKLVKALWWLTIEIAKALWWLVTGIALIIYDNYNKRHRDKLRNSENILRLVIALFMLYILSKALLDADWRLGVSFIIAGLTAVWFGYIYRGREVMGLVLVGVIIGSLVTVLAPDAWQALSTGDFIGAVVIIGIMIYLYFISREYKKGKRPR